MSLLASIWTFLRRVPDWLWWVFLALATATFIDMRARADERQKVNARRDKEAAEVERDIIENITENSNELVRESNAVRDNAAAIVMPDGSATLEKHHYRD